MDETSPLTRDPYSSINSLGSINPDANTADWRIRELIILSFNFPVLLTLPAPPDTPFRDIFCEKINRQQRNHYFIEKIISELRNGTPRNVTEK